MAINCVISVQLRANNLPFAKSMQSILVVDRQTISSVSLTTRIESVTGLFSPL
jgi:hypothetical protein